MGRRLSRLERHRKKQSNRQAVVYVLLSVLFIGALIKWGVPGLIDLAAWWTDNREVVQKNEERVRPQRPVLDPAPEATFSAEIDLSGYSLSDMRVRLRVNGLDTDEARTDSDGRFSFSAVGLVDGENRIEVRTVDDNDNESETTTAVVVLDTDKPVLDILEPKEERQFYGLGQRNLEIVGKVDEPEDSVTVNDNFARVTSDGSFVFKTVMSEGSNEFVIKVVDKAGNVTERFFRVFYSP